MKKKLIKPISFLLLAVMLMSVLCVAPFSASAVTTYHVSDADGLNSAVAAISEAKSGVIELEDDITGSITLAVSGAELTLIGNGHTLSNPTQTICVSNGATVNLGDGNSALYLTSDTNNDNQGVVYILGENSVCNMYDKVTIKDHEGSNCIGGGVTVESGTFNMHGGTISNCGIYGGSVCYGGGVAVYGGGTFNMNGGVITDCYAAGGEVADNSFGHYYPSIGGGVIVTGVSEFNMTGGIIENNYADYFGGGIAVVTSNDEVATYHKNAAGNGVFGYLDSRLSISGGTIRENESSYGGGIFASGNYGVNFSALATSNPKIGTPITPGIFIEQSGSNEIVIDGNTATYGAGVCVNAIRSSINAKIKNAAITNNNAAKYGGGVYIYAYWTQSDIDSCVINNNQAGIYGGGVCALNNWDDGTRGTLIKDTEIKGNSSGSYGGGVFYDARDEVVYSKIHFTGKNIVQDNKVNSKLNNVYVLDIDAPIIVDGDLTGSKIGLTDPTLWDDGLADTADEAVSTEYLTSGFKANNAIVPAEAFTSDHESWYVDRSQSKSITVEDTTSKKYRKYTVNRYPVTSENNNPFGVVNDYLYFQSDNSDEIITNLDALFNELVDKYSPLAVSTIFSQPAYKRYTMSDNTQVNIQKKDTVSSNEVTLSFSKNNCSVTYTTSPNIQNTYANKGEIVFKITSKGYYANLNNYTFSSEPTETEIKYVNSAPTSDIIYEYNDLGVVTAKLEIVGGKDSYNEVYVETTTTTGTDAEVRLVRYDVNYYINNDDMDDSIYADEVFTPYVENHEVKAGNTIQEFHNIPKLKDPDGYVFKGWYYDQDNSNDSNPIVFNTEYQRKEYETGINIYAHWEKVDTVDQESGDGKVLPADMNGKYSSFGLFGVQIRPEEKIDLNQDSTTKRPGGLRFITSISERLLSDIDALSNKKVLSDTGDEHDVEYGYVAARKDMADIVAQHYGKTNEDYTLQYCGEDANGVDTTGKTLTAETDYRYITNVDCTRMDTRVDHKEMNNYRLSTFVVTYEGESAVNRGDMVCARAYIRYYDANGLLRTFYNDYGGTTTYGGCCTSYNEAAAGGATNENTYYKEGA